MTREEILQERKWLGRKTNKSLPGYEGRLIEYNRQVELFNKDIKRRAREATKTLKVGDIVYLPDRFNRKGFWRVDKIMVKNVLLAPVGESGFRGRLKASAEMLTRVQGEDESLVNALDDIGLM